MNVYDERFHALESEIRGLRASLETVLSFTASSFSLPKKHRAKLLNLFGEWDGEIDEFLQNFYARRARRGRGE